MAKIALSLVGSSRESVEIDTKFALVEVVEPNGLQLISKAGDLLIISETEDGGFELSYRSHYKREQHFDAGQVQFKNGIIRRPGEEGYVYGRF